MINLNEVSVQFIEDLSVFVFVQQTVEFLDGSEPQSPVSLLVGQHCKHRAQSLFEH